VRNAELVDAAAVPGFVVVPMVRRIRARLGSNGSSTALTFRAADLDHLREHAVCREPQPSDPDLHGHVAIAEVIGDARASAAGRAHSTCITLSRSATTSITCPSAATTRSPPRITSPRASTMATSSPDSSVARWRLFWRRSNGQAQPPDYSGTLRRRSKARADLDHQKRK
jgi:hypothetical protein